VEFTESTYEAGAAHPNSSTTVLNYDVKGGKSFYRRSFQPESELPEDNLDYCIKELKDRSKKR